MEFRVRRIAGFPQDKDWEKENYKYSLLYLCLFSVYLSLFGDM